MESCSVQNCRGLVTFRLQSAIGQILFCEVHKPQITQLTNGKRKSIQVNPLCEVKGCSNVATFRTPNRRKLHRCATHKEEGMISKHKALCNHEDCHKRATHNFHMGEHPIFCAEHHTNGMINIVTRRCAFAGCTAVPSFGRDGKAIFCAKHQDINMHDVKHPKCQFTGEHGRCNKQASYAIGGSITPLFCAKHRQDNMIDIKNPRCIIAGCTSYAHFDLPDHKPPRYCFAHKGDGMINVKAHLCEEPGCQKRPNFNVAGTRHPIFCKAHKKPGMIDVTKICCQFPGCQKRAQFSLSEKPTHCAKHKTIEMQNVKEHKCLESGCQKTPIYGAPNTKRGLYCADHKKPGMKDVRHHTCQYNGCELRPTFAPKGTKIPIYCAAHKPANQDIIDVVNKNCTIDGCTTRAAYGPVFGRALYCSTHYKTLHKEKGLICYKDRFPKCQFQRCAERPTHTEHPTENYPTHCTTHAPANARAISSAICSSCHLDAIVSTTSGMCAYCEFGALYGPGAYHKVKEDRMFSVLNQIGFPPTTRDRQIDYASLCGIRKRPDNFYDFGFFALIIEVDEHQHAYDFTKFVTKPEATDPNVASSSTAAAPRNNYSCDCEYARMVSIHQVIGLPTIFIRYNPDKYVDDTCKHHKSSNDISRDQKAALFAKHIAETVQQKYATQPNMFVGLYAAYLYYDGAHGDDGALYKIDYIQNILEPWQILNA